MRQIVMNLQVKADTAAAQQNLQQLGSLLQQIGSSKVGLDSGPIVQASRAAQQLQVHLQNATNVNTGKIDLNKLDLSLKSSNTNLLTLTKNLQKAGPTGQQAFLKVAQAISQAEAPLVQVNDKLKNFGITLLNTIKWQLASNLIHGVQGAIEGAVSHAKDLNSALNDIRIVTGYSSDYMADFTAKASEAAKQLNTTTVEYSKAALIFYQQGLSGQDVEKRVSTVIKLSEVTGQSAEEISSQMTAIWNNFDDGSHSLEYYADVITKLGASTASSSAEISNGLQKFAAIGDTVGLSYEKAASSLATVVAETRQSEEVVGTAFKTIFARMEGLSLGETLEDGVDLNKYSEALKTVGVNVLDTKGKMKDMDVILDSLGKKWKVLGQEQQIALAQTVAGVRQYNQFISLMDNYDEVLKNEDLAKNSSGTLSKQAEIWSESWEAASKRVQKSQQDLYESIISDKTLIKFEDMFSSLINGVNNFIKSSGGIVPVLASVVGMASNTLFPLLQNGFKQLHNNIKIWSGDAAQDFATMQGALSGQMSQLLDNNTNLSNAERQQIEITQDLINKKTLLTLQSKSMSEAEKIEAQNKIAILEATGNLAKAALERQANAEKELATILKLTDAEEKYRVALSKQMVDLGDSEEDQKKRQILETAQERGRNTDETKQNITDKKQDLQSAQKVLKLTDQDQEDLRMADFYQEEKEKLIQKQNTEKLSPVEEQDLQFLNEELDKINKITESLGKENQYLGKSKEEIQEIIKNLGDELRVEQDILKTQEEARKTKMDSKNEFGTQDINSYKDKDENGADLHNTTNEMIGNTIGNNKNLGAGDADTIKISEEAYMALAKAEIEAKMASEDFLAMSTELNTLLATNAEEIEGVNAATVKTATEKRNAAQAAENLAKSASKEANAERLNVQNLKNQLAALKNSKASHSEIIQVKSKLANAEQKLQNATKKEIKAQQDAKKAMQDLVASTTPAARVFSNVSSNIHEMGSKLGLTKKDLNEFDQKMKQALEQDTAEGKIEAVQAILDELAASSDAAGFAFEQMGLDMQKALSSEGFSPERLGEVKDGIQGTAEATHDAKQATDQYGGSLDENDKKQKKIGSKLTGIATVLGKVTMGYNALKSVVNVWSDDDASLMDKIMTTFTSISMILPLISGEYGILNGVKAINNMLEKTGHSAKIKGLAAWAAEKIQTAENTGSTWAYVAAKVAQKIAENGWAGIVLGVALVAAIGIAAATISATAATEKNTEAIKKQNEATQENAENTSKAAEKWQEESNTMDELIKKYKDLKNAQEDVTQTQKDILDQAPALIDSYKELNKTLQGTGIDLTKDIEALEHAVAAGDIDKVIALKKQIDAKAAEGTKEATAKGATAAMNTTKNKMKESGPNAKSEDDSISFSSGGYGSEEKTAGAILTEKLNKAGGTAYMKKGKNFLGMDVKDVVDFKLDASKGHEADFVKQYEALQEAKKEMEAQGVSTNSDIYKDLNKMLEDSKEQYEEVKKLVGDVDTYNIETLASDIDLTSISSYAEYEEKINQLKKEAVAEAEKNGEISEEEKKRIEDSVDTWAKGKEVLEEYTKVAEKLKYVEDQHGEAVKEELNDYYKELQKTDPEKAKLFVNVDFSKVASKEALDAELDYLQAEAEHTKIQTKIELVEEGSKAIKTDGSMTEEDWKKVDAMKSTIESDMGMSYDNFLTLDSNSQKTILTDYKKNKQWEDAKAQLTKVSVAEENAALLKSKKERAQNEANDSKKAQEKFLNEDALKLKEMSSAQKGEVSSLINGDSFTSALQLKEEIDDYNDLTSDLEESQKNLTKAQTDYNGALTNLQTAKADAAKTINDIITSSTSLAELEENTSKLQEMGADINDYQGAISTTLITMGENYDNCSEEVLKYQQAIASGSEILENETEALLRNAIAVAELSEKLDLEAESVEEQAKELISVNNLSEENYKVATKVAILNQTMNKGVSALVENWSEYKETLKSAQKGTEDYANAALKTKEALAQLLGVTDADYIPDDFLDLPGVMDLIDKAVEGDEKAINSLGVTMAKATIEAMQFKEGLEGINGVELTLETFNNYKNEVLEGITSLADAIENGTLQAGEDITSLMNGMGTSWAEALNEMAYTTGMSVDEMNSLLNELGVQADVTTKTKMVDTTVPQYETTETLVQEQGYDNEGKPDPKKPRIFTSETRVKDYKKVQGAIEVAQINMGEENAGTPPTITYAGRDNVSTSALTPSDSTSKSSAASSSSDKKNTSPASHKHEVNRYSNEENAVEGLTKQYERLNKVKDKAFGASKIFAMEQELKALKDLKKASTDYLDAIVGSGNGAKIAQELAQGGNLGSMIAGGRIGGTAGADYRALFSGADASGKQVEYTAKDNDGNQWLSSSGFSLGSFNSMFGTNLSFSLDSYGNIQNKDSILNLIQNLTNSENDAYARVADPDAGSTTEHNKRLAYLEAMKERIEQYGNTVDTLNDKVDEYLDRITEIQEKNAEIISAKLEQGVNLGQKTIQRLERSLKVLGDNIYKTAEAMSKWYDANFNKGVEADKKQADAAIAAIADAEARVKLYEKNPYDENAISPEQAAEIIDSAEGTLDSVIDSLLQRVEEGKEYFGNVLDYWNEKFDNVNASIENNIKILDHFQNILSLLGKSADYGRMNILLEGQSKAAEDNYNSLKRQAQVAEQAYKEAEKGAIGLSGEALQEYKDNVLQKAYENFQNAVDAMYSGLESWIEIENAKFENSVSQTFAKTEDKLTGEWGGFDALDAAMNRQRSVAEEYLTKTNQLYETNSLMRKLSQDIDKTDSKVAKNKLKAFSDEIKAMQEQEKLSKTDLEIAKARYEVLQAELALEEVKNAKTTVRLQRDNEGNFGYVYTADQDQVADAEQTLEDKQNALYNLGLETAQEYGEKIISIRKEWQAEIDTVIQDWREGKISSEEELNTILADINARYRELETSYLESYVAGNNVLNETGAEGQTEAWTNSFNEIITEHRLFNDESENALNSNSQTVQSIAEETTNNLLERMSDLNEQRNFFEKEAEVGNSQLKRSVGEVTTSVSNLSKEVTKKGGLADSFVSAAAKAQELTNKFFNQYNALQDLIRKYSDAANEANSFYQEMVSLINVQVAYNHAKNGATAVSWGNGSSSVYSSYDNGGSGGGGGSGSNGISGNGGGGSKKGVDPNHFYYFYNGGVKFQVSGQYVYTKSHPGEYWWHPGGDPNKEQEVYYKSGGYTGSWNGPDVEENGKLAFLHQKELVLNAADTENMLEAVKLIRQISQQIDLQAVSQSSGFSAVATQFFSDREPLQQDITIHAEFPNATDHNEIEQAFDNLANKAAQFANRY